MIFIRIDPSNDFEIALDETTQPIVSAGFRRGKPGKIRFLDNLIGGDHTHHPAGKSPRDITGVIDPMGDELGFAAENPVFISPVQDAE